MYLFGSAIFDHKNAIARPNWQVKLKTSLFWHFSPQKWKFCQFFPKFCNFYTKRIIFAFDGRKNVQSWSCLRLCPVGFFFLECCAPINILKCNYLRFFSRLAVNILLWWLYIVMTKMNIKMKWSGHP